MKKSNLFAESNFSRGTKEIIFLTFTFFSMQKLFHEKVLPEIFFEILKIESQGQFSGNFLFFLLIL